jgi:hypothetical protein
MTEQAQRYGVWRHARLLSGGRARGSAQRCPPSSRKQGKLRHHQRRGLARRRAGHRADAPQVLRAALSRPSRRAGLPRSSERLHRERASFLELRRELSEVPIARGGRWVPGDRAVPAGWPPCCPRRLAPGSSCAMTAPPAAIESPGPAGRPARPCRLLPNSMPPAFQNWTSASLIGIAADTHQHHGAGSSRVPTAPPAAWLRVSSPHRVRPATRSSSGVTSAPLARSVLGD